MILENKLVFWHGLVHSGVRRNVELRVQFLKATNCLCGLMIVVYEILNTKLLEIPSHSSIEIFILAHKVSCGRVHLGAFVKEMSNKGCSSLVRSLQSVDIIELSSFVEMLSIHKVQIYGADVIFMSLREVMFFVGVIISEMLENYLQQTALH